MEANSKADLLLIAGWLGLLHHLAFPLATNSSFGSASILALVLGNMVVALLLVLIANFLPEKLKLFLKRIVDFSERLKNIRKPAWIILGLLFLAVQLASPSRDLNWDYEGQWKSRENKTTSTTVSLSQPDIYLISADTFRADAMKDYVSAKNLIRLSKSGIAADYALASSNQTLPSHVGLLAGVGAEVHGLSSNTDRVPGELITIAQTLRGRGFNTCGIVTNGLLASSSGLNRGFELWNDRRVKFAGSARLFSRNLINKSAVGILSKLCGLDGFLQRKLLPDLWQLKLESASRGSGAYVVEQVEKALPLLNTEPRPHFMFLHLMDTHAPYAMPSEDFSWPEPYRLDETGRISSECLSEIERDLNSGNDQIRRHAQRAIAVAKKAYAEEVRRVDAAVAKLHTLIEASGRPYVLLFTSDHGEHFGEHGLMEHANSMYEPLLRVPFFMVGTKIKAQQVAPPHLSQFAEFLNKGGVYALPPSTHLSLGGREISFRDGARKWIAVLKEENLEHISFVDLRADSGEIRDLGEGQADEYRTRVHSVLSSYLKRQSMKETLSGERDNEHDALLESLGYKD